MDICLKSTLYVLPVLKINAEHTRCRGLCSFGCSVHSGPTVGAAHITSCDQCFSCRSGVPLALRRLVSALYCVKLGFDGDRIVRTEPPDRGRVRVGRQRGELRRIFHQQRRQSGRHVRIARVHLQLANASASHRAASAVERLCEFAAVEVVENSLHCVAGNFGSAR